MFHELFFNNDLWILDPRTELLIRMLPEGFFFDMVVRIGWIFSVLLIILLYISGVILWKQKARKTYDNILRLSDDPDVNNVIRFLREREIVHYQRFQEALGIVQDHLDECNFYAFNPALK